MKRLLTEWQNIFANHIPEKGLMFKIDALDKGLMFKINNL